MALVDAATFKTQMAAVAAALTTAYSDTVLTEVAAEVSNPLHPLRNFHALLILNPATGVYTSKDAAIDAIYAGNAAPSASKLDKVTNVASALTTATVEDAGLTDIILTFDKNIKAGGIQTVSVGGDAAPAKVIKSTSIAKNVVTITVDTDYITTDTITVSGVFITVSNNSITLAAEAVTNNITP